MYGVFTLLSNKQEFFEEFCQKHYLIKSNYEVQQLCAGKTVGEKRLAPVFIDLSSTTEISLLVKKNMLQGIIVPVDANDLISTTLACELEFDEIKQSMISLCAQTNHSITVYVLVINTHKISGSEDYFKGINKKRICKLLGYINTGVGRDNEENIKENLEKIQTKLADCRLTVLREEKNSVCRKKLVCFPEHFSHVVRELREVIRRIFFYHQPIKNARIGGVLFSVSQKFPDESTMHEICNSNSEKNNRKLSLSAWSQKKCCWVSGLVVGLMAFSMTVAYYSNKYYLAENSKVILQTTELEKDKQSSPLSSYYKLDKLYALYEKANNRKNSVTRILSLGFDQAEKLLPTIKETIKDNVYALLYYPIKNSLTNKIKIHKLEWNKLNADNKKSARGDYFANLKYYLLWLFPGFINTAPQEMLSLHDWYNLISLSTMGRTLNEHKKNRLTQLLLFYFKMSNEQKITMVTNESKKMIQAARRQLLSSNLQENIYAELLSLAIMKCGTLTINQLDNDIYKNLFYNESVIPKIFISKKYNENWHSFLKQQGKINKRDDWVLNYPLSYLFKLKDINLLLSDQSESTSVNVLQKLFNLDHKKYWQDFIINTKLQPFHSLTDAVKKLSSLSNNESPMKTLLNRYMQALDDKNKSTVHRADLIKNYISKMAQLVKELEQINSSNERNYEARIYAKKVLTKDANHLALFQLEESAKKISFGFMQPGDREALETFLNQPIKNVWMLLLAMSRQDIRVAWQRQVLSPYHADIEGRFPFDKNGPDISLNHFQHFFHPSRGSLMLFINKLLSPFIIKNDKYWRENTWLRQGVGFSTKILSQLRMSEQLSKLFYQGDKNKFGIHYEISPIPETDLNEIVLETDSGEMTYRNGPQDWNEYFWPQRDKLRDSVLTALTATGKQHVGKVYHSQWGIFHLLSDAKLIKREDNTYSATWYWHKKNKLTHKVDLLVRFFSDVDMAYLFVHSKYDLPEELFKKESQEVKWMS